MDVGARELQRQVVRARPELDLPEAHEASLVAKLVALGASESAVHPQLDRGRGCRPPARPRSARRQEPRGSREARLLHQAWAGRRQRPARRPDSPPRHLGLEHAAAARQGLARPSRAASPRTAAQWGRDRARRGAQRQVPAGRTGAGRAFPRLVCVPGPHPLIRGRRAAGERGAPHDQVRYTNRSAGETSSVSAQSPFGATSPPRRLTSRRRSSEIASGSASRRK